MSRNVSFQLTRPVWGEPIGGAHVQHDPEISTHSPRVGRTGLGLGFLGMSSQFQLTRPVWGEPATALTLFTLTAQFQLTRPVWGEPSDLRLRVRRKRISTHSPRVGRTSERSQLHAVLFHFNSLAPCGANPLPRRLVDERLHFNSLAPCGANHVRTVATDGAVEISTHSPRVGRTRRDRAVFL